MATRFQGGSSAWHACRRLALGLGLIAGVSAILLVSDCRQRRDRQQATMPSVALLQFASRPVLDDSIRGIRDGLAEQGFIEDQTIRYQGFNAEGDMVTANAVAQRIVDGGFDMVISASTPSLQTMAAANRDGRVIHVFGTVTDPFTCEVGITGEGPGEHPDWLAGMGTFQPVGPTLELLQKMNPRARKVGMVMNPADACSVACLGKAEVACERLGLTLLVAQVENTAGCFEAAASLAARGVEAIFIGGDNQVEAAMESIVRAADKAGIPVFACAPDHVKLGALVGVGANYYEVGRHVGLLAGDILAGKTAPREVAIKDLMPRKVALNEQALARVSPTWSFPAEMLAAADIVVTRDGRWEDRKAPAVEDSLRPRLAKVWNLHFIGYVEAPMTEQWLAGWRDEAARLGLVEGTHYHLTYRNAQGDMATLNTMIDAARDDRADLLLTMSTPTLSAVVRKEPGMPVVFGLSANPLLAGVGNSYADHLPWLTGIATPGAYETMAGVLRECLPQARQVGSLINPAEDNSEYNCDQTAKALAAVGIELVTVATPQSADVPGGAQALANRRVDAICQTISNLHDASFPAIARTARQARLPLFTFSSGQIAHGAAVAVARDFEQGGRDHARLTLRVMNGEDPAGLPIRNVSKTLLVVSPENARQTGFTIPAAVLNRADLKVEP